AQPRDAQPRDAHVDDAERDDARADSGADAVDSRDAAPLNTPLKLAPCHDMTTIVTDDDPMGFVYWMENSGDILSLAKATGEFHYVRRRREGWTAWWLARLGDSLYWVDNENLDAAWSFGKGAVEWTAIDGGSENAEYGDEFGGWSGLFAIV